jgi:hypothetical protein
MTKSLTRFLLIPIAIAALAVLSTTPLLGDPALLHPDQLDQLVARIALYSDPLLAQVLTASTYADQISGAAAWAEQHRYLHGDDLARAISEDHLPWDPSVLALLPFPSVLDVMNRDMAWTRHLGDAVLTQRSEVMDAVQRMRRKAHDHGYLQSNAYIRVLAYPSYLEILPVDPAYICVPVYDPVIVFSRPVGRIVVSAAISFGPPVFIGPAFVAFGWAHPGFLWPSHILVIDHEPWRRTWVNRQTYVHPYTRPWVRPVEPQVERHGIHRPLEAQRRGGRR